MRRFLSCVLALLLPLAALAQSDPQPNLTQIGVTAAFTAEGHNGSGVGVAVLDGAVDITHPFLSSHSLLFKPYGGTYYNPPPSGGSAWHATHIAGTIASNSTLMRGIAPQAWIHSYAINDDTGAALALGDFGKRVLDHILTMNAVGWNIRVANMSYNFGSVVFGGYFGAELNLLDDYQSNFVIVRAAGNNGAYIGNEYYTGNASATLKHLIIVGSVGPTNVISSFSNKPGNGCFATSWPNCSPANMVKNFFVVAPGENIWSTFPGNALGYWSGTSFATDEVSAAVALVAQANPSLTPAQIADVIFETATDLGDPGVDGIYGHGLINVPAAVALAMTL